MAESILWSAGRLEKRKSIDKASSRSANASWKVGYLKQSVNSYHKINAKSERKGEQSNAIGEV